MNAPNAPKINDRTKVDKSINNQAKRARITPHKAVGAFTPPGPPTAGA